MSRLAFQLSLGVAVSSLVMNVASARDFAQPPQAPSPSTDDQLGQIISSNDVAREGRDIAPPMVTRAIVRELLLANRRANIARFHAYRVAGVYPSNVFTTDLANVWRDQDGHYCAAATIIYKSGDTVLVEKIAEDNNFFRIKDVEQGPVMDWILTSGLTQAELVMIQKPFMPVTQRPELDPVEPIVVDSKLRAAETARLAKLYRSIEAKLVKNQRVNLELAIDRLMKRPDLVEGLLARPS